MKCIASLLLLLVLCSCSSEGDSQPATAPVAEANAPAPEPTAPSRDSRQFDLSVCEFLTAAEIADVLGARASSVTADTNIPDDYCMLRYIVAVPDGGEYKMHFVKVESSPKGVAKQIKSFEEYARDIGKLMKHEMSSSGEVHIGTHGPQRRLYAMLPGQSSYATLAYDDRSRKNRAKTPEEAEARRQDGIRVMNYWLEK